MATLNVTTKSAEQVWASPDGKMTIFKLLLEMDGKTFEAKTYSKAIANVGWSGEIESYEKQGKQGAETFVKQPQKEGFGGGFSGGGRSKLQDQFTMYLSYAKDLAVASIHDDKFDDKMYTELLGAVEAGGAQLYAGRPNATEVEAKVKEAFSDKKEELVPIVTDEDLDNIGKLPL